MTELPAVMLAPAVWEYQRERIESAVWEARTRVETRDRGRVAPLVVLAGYDLWTFLVKHPEVDLPGRPWSMRDNVLRFVDHEVHPVDIPAVATPDSWRMLRDLARG